MPKLSCESYFLLFPHHETSKTSSLWAQRPSHSTLVAEHARSGCHSRFYWRYVAQSVAALLEQLKSLASYSISQRLFVLYWIAQTVRDLRSPIFCLMVRQVWLRWEWTCNRPCKGPRVKKILKQLLDTVALRRFLFALLRGAASPVC